MAVRRERAAVAAASQTESVSEDFSSVLDALY